MPTAKPAILRLRSLGLIFWLQVAVLAAATGSVEAAKWVDAPSLLGVSFLAALMAAFVASRSKPRKLHHLWVFLAGIIIAYAGGIYLAEADPWYLRFEVMHGRAVDWWAAVSGDDVTTDTLPLAMILVNVTWLVSYFTSWALFRFRAVWATLVPLGAGTVINLTYLPEKYSAYFFAFLFVGLILLVHVTSLKRRADLTSRGIPYPPSIHGLSQAHGLWISAIALAVVLVMPLSSTPPTPLKMAINPINHSVDSLRTQLHRIFAVIPGHNLDSMRFFGSVLPLIRPVPTATVPVFFSDSTYPLYWPAIAYDQYSSTAWKVEETETSNAYYEIEGLGGEEQGVSLGASSITYGVEMYVDSPYLMVSGTPLYLPDGVERQMPVSPVYGVNLQTPEQNNGDLPADLQRWAESVNESTKDGRNLAAWQVPDNLRVSKVIKGIPGQRKSSVVNIKTDGFDYNQDLTQALKSAGKTIGLEISRRADPSSVVAYKPQERLKATSEYQVSVDLNIPSEATLRYAPRGYPPEITDRYLQLPDSLPSRVVTLARALTGNVLSPYDKAVAIETYLRDLNYVPTSHPLPHNVDVVDHFLFESQEGYGDYFASAMAVMLRAINIPTRLILGFGPGEQMEDAGFMVRDKDSHAWPEVYFPYVGWVPFEPTPIYDTRVRGLPNNPLAYFDMPGGNEEGEPIEGLDGLEENPGELRNDKGGPLPGGDGIRPPLTRHFGTPLGMGGVFFALFLIVGAILMRVLWWSQYGGLREPSTAFERMRRLATFMGIPSPLSQTPYELAYSLSGVIPEATEDIHIICDSFVLQHYGGKMPTAIEGLRVIRAWNRMKRVLLAQGAGAREPLSSTA